MSTAVAENEFKFETVTIPKLSTGAGRPKLPNPFEKAVRDAWEHKNGASEENPDGFAVQFVTDMGEAYESESKGTLYKGVERVKNQLRLAGQEVGCTVRTSVELNLAANKPAKGKATVQFWTVPKITRTRKTDETTATE